MRVVTWNVNGLRSVVRRDFDDWLRDLEADVVCLQEVKTGEDLLTSQWFKGYEAVWNAAERPGYAGVATLVRRGVPLGGVVRGIDHCESDGEGRVLTLDADGITIVNVYAPHSHRKLTRLEHKLAFLKALDRTLDRLIAAGRPFILAGDLNVAHLEIDVANARGNTRNAGFLPQERAWFAGILERGMIDAFRAFDPEPGRYTWWSMREGVRERNVGWRLDYILASPSLRSRLRHCRHLTERLGSDHCPVLLDLY